MEPILPPTSPKTKRQRAWAKLRPAKKLSLSSLNDDAIKLKKTQSLPVFRRTFSVEDPLPPSPPVCAAYRIEKRSTANPTSNSTLSKPFTTSFKDRLLCWLKFGNKKQQQQLVRRPSMISRYSVTLEAEDSDAPAEGEEEEEVEEQELIDEKYSLSFFNDKIYENNVYEGDDKVRVVDCNDNSIEEENSQVTVSPPPSSSSASSIAPKSQDELPRGMSEKLSNLSIRKIQDGNRNLHQLLLIHLVLVKCNKMDTSSISSPDSDEYREINILNGEGEAGKVRETVKVVSFSTANPITRSITSSSLLMEVCSSSSSSAAATAATPKLWDQELTLFGNFLSNNNSKTETGLNISYGASITVTTDFLPVISAEGANSKMIADDMWNEVSRNVERNLLTISLTADIHAAEEDSGNLGEEMYDEGASDRSSGDSGYISLDGDEEVKEPIEVEWDVETRLLSLQENLLSIFDGF